MARKTLPARIAKRIQFPHTRNQCWIWSGPTAYVTVDGVKVTARRAVYAYLVEEPTTPLYADCGNGDCVNPRHMIVKIGRQPKPPRQKKTGARPWKAAGAR